MFVAGFPESNTLCSAEVANCAILFALKLVFIVVKKLEA